MSCSWAWPISCPKRWATLKKTLGPASTGCPMKKPDFAINRHSFLLCSKSSPASKLKMPCRISWPKIMFPQDLANRSQAKLHWRRSERVIHQDPICCASSKALCHRAQRPSLIPVPIWALQAPGQRISIFCPNNTTPQKGAEPQRLLPVAMTAHPLESHRSMSLRSKRPWDASTKQRALGFCAKA